MKRSRFSDEQVIGILQEQEVVAKRADLCRKHGISEGTIYAWKPKYSGMGVPDVKCLKSLEHVVIADPPCDGSMNSGCPACS